MDLTKFRDLKDLESLLELMGRYELSELELEGEGQRIRLRRSEPQAPREIISYAAPAASAAAPMPAEMAPAGAAETAATPEAPSGHEVTSPLVGSFYRSPSPEAEPFVREGDKVDAETVLCIIEAMKVMNEIRAGVSGVVREILVKNTDAVEFGQPLFRIDTE